MISPPERKCGAVLVLAAFLVACGGGGGSDSTPSGAAGASPPPAQNRPPQMVRGPRQTDELALIGFPYDFDVTEGDTAFRDPDGDSLSYEVRIESGSSDRCDLTVAGTHLRGTPARTGSCGVQVFTRDGRGGELGTWIRVNQDFNQTPTVAMPNPNRVVEAGAPIDYDATQGGATFADRETRQLSYHVSIVDAPAGFSVQGTRIVGSLAGPGYAKVRIQAADGFGGVTADSFAFVVPHPINKRPTLPQAPYDYADSRLPLPENLTRLDDGRLDIDDTASRFLVVTDAGAALGRVLFYDKRLSITNTHACATCHIQSHNFSSIEVLPRGCVGVPTLRTPMPLANVRFNSRNAFFADSRGITLEASVLMPIQERDELGSSSLLELERELANTDYYPPLFMAAFTTTDVTSERIASALAQFLRSLISYRTRWDRARDAVPEPRPDAATFMTAQEQRGFEVYREGECFWCHETSKFVSPGPENNGLDAADSVTEPGARLFRVASLRSIASSPPYMHDGRFASLRDVINHYSTGIQANPNLGVFLKGPGGNPRVFNFTEEDKAALEGFLNGLTDTEFLTDPRFSDPF